MSDNHHGTTEAAAPDLPPPIFLARQPLLQESDWGILLRANQAGKIVKNMLASGGQNAAVALNLLGRCYEYGWGIEVDLDCAFSYYQKAADQGDLWALFNLADCYRKGVGCVADASRAAELYAQAASKGHVKSLNMLGLAYEEGSGVEQNHERAAQYFAKGAAQGDCWASFNHARLLAAKGEREQSLHWLEHSLRQQSGDYCQIFAALFAASPDKKLRILAAKADEIARL